MSKMLLWILVVLILIGGGYYLFTRSQVNTNPSTTAGTQLTAAPTAQTGAFSGTLADLLKRGGNYKCNWSHTASGTTIQGITYVSGDKFAGTGNAQLSSGMSMTTNVLGDGTTMYTWTQIAGQTVGTKISYAEMKAAAPTGTTQQQVDQARQSMNYDCSPWIPDPSKFVVPSGVTFK